jgi:hypothetical protein
MQKQTLKCKVHFKTSITQFQFHGVMSFLCKLILSSILPRLLVLWMNLFLVMDSMDQFMGTLWHCPFPQAFIWAISPPSSTTYPIAFPLYSCPLCISLLTTSSGPFSFPLIHILFCLPLLLSLMDQGGSHHRSRGGHHRALGSKVISTDNRVSTVEYHAHTPPEIQEEIDLVEADVRVLRHFISNEEVTYNIRSWVPDPGSTRESQYFKTIDLY